MYVLPFPVRCLPCPHPTTLTSSPPWPMLMGAMVATRLFSLRKQWQGGGVSSREQLISKVDKGPYDNNKGVQGDNSSALKASGYRVMDDMAIQGMGQGQGRGLGSSQGADTNGVLTSPVTRSGKKKKLGGPRAPAVLRGAVTKQLER